MTFESLCAELGINAEQTEAQKLKLLKTWFRKNLSQDMQFSGSDSEQFKQYRQITKGYLEHIQPKLQHDLSQLNPKFNDETLVFELAALGFDQVILAAKPSRAALDIPNQHQLTPLHRAAIEGLLHTVKTLVDLGASTNTLNRGEQYPLFGALLFPMTYEESYKNNKIAIFRFLRDKGNQPLNHKDYDGNTVLHQMALHDLVELIEETLATDPDIARIPNHHTHYPIHTAILNNQLHSVTTLLKSKDGASLADSNGWLAIHYAARHARPDVLQACCQYTETINAQDTLGRTALMLAASLGRLDTVKTLIEHGAQTSITDLNGDTVLHHAVQSGRLELVRWLIEEKHIEISNQDLTKALQANKSGNSETREQKQITALLNKHQTSTASSMSCR